MKTYLSVVLAVLMTCMTAHAAVNIDRTRLVFNERDKAVSLKIENESKKLPYLAYAWVTDSQGQKNDDFFIALPPIQRLEPGAMSQVRIMKQNTARLPQDRESLFYFDLREIPPQPDLQGKKQRRNAARHAESHQTVLSPGRSTDRKYPGPGNQTEGHSEW